MVMASGWGGEKAIGVVKRGDDWNASGVVLVRAAQWVEREKRRGVAVGGSMDRLNGSDSGDVVGWDV